MRTFLVALFIAAAAVASAQSASRIVYFDSGKSQLATKDVVWLDSIAAFLKITSGYSITIKAYCDADGSNEMNQELAGRRAEALKTVLIKTLGAEKITADAFGENDPVADNETEAGKAKNRRATIIVAYEQPKKMDVAAVQPMAEEIEKVLDDAPAVSLSKSKLEVGKRIVLQNMNFEGGTAVMLPESEPVLKELLKL